MKFTNKYMGGLAPCISACVIVKSAFNEIYQQIYGRTHTMHQRMRNCKERLQINHYPVDSVVCIVNTYPL